MRRRLRQRRPDRPLHHQRRTERALSECGSWPVHRGPEGRRRRRRCGARAARSSTSIATATSISSSRTTWTAAASEERVLRHRRSAADPGLLPPADLSAVDERALPQHRPRAPSRTSASRAEWRRYRGNGLGVAVTRHRRRRLAGRVRRQRHHAEFPVSQRAERDVHRDRRSGRRRRRRRRKGRGLAWERRSPTSPATGAPA